MAWVELHDTLSEHPKTEALADALAINQAWAIGILSALWTWAIRNAPDGDLSKISDRAIARACFWVKRPDALVGALTQCGWIDGDRQIHDWSDYAGRRMAFNEMRRARDRDRQRKYRYTTRVTTDDVTRDTDDVTRDKDDCHTDDEARDTSVSHGYPLGTVPNLTVPNLTVPNLTVPLTEPHTHGFEDSYYDDAWRTSSRARGAVARRVTDRLSAQGCRGSNLYDVVLEYLALGLAPAEIVGYRDMRDVALSAALWDTCRAQGIESRTAAEYQERHGGADAAP